MNFLQLTNVDSNPTVIAISAIDMLKSDADGRTRISLRGGSEIRVVENFQDVLDQLQEKQAK